MTKEEKSSFAELKKQIEELQKQKGEYLAGWQRARADLLNYKKEEMERIDGILQYAQEEFILKILPILDNFNLALKEIPEELKKNEHPEGLRRDVGSYGASVKGLLQIKTQIEDFLKSQGVEEIKAVGKKFDPNFHEIIGEVNPSEASAKEGEFSEPGVIVEEAQKGYTISGKLLRPAKVKINK